MYRVPPAPDDIRDELAAAGVEEFVDGGVAFYEGALARAALATHRDAAAGTTTGDAIESAVDDDDSGLTLLGDTRRKMQTVFHRGRTAAMSADADPDELPKGWRGKYVIPPGA